MTLPPAISMTSSARATVESVIVLNDGKAGFAKTVAFGPAVTNARAAAAGDLNGDGWLDLVVGDEGTGTRVYLNDGHGMPSRPQTVYVYLDNRAPVTGEPHVRGR